MMTYPTTIHECSVYGSENLVAELKELGIPYSKVGVYGGRFVVVGAPATLHKLKSVTLVAWREKVVEIAVS